MVLKFCNFLVLWNFPYENVFVRAQESGIDKIIPGMVIDDFLFDPCGYSMNGVAKDVSYNYFIEFGLIIFPFCAE